MRKTLPVTVSAVSDNSPASACAGSASQTRARPSSKSRVPLAGCRLAGCRASKTPSVTGTSVAASSGCATSWTTSSAGTVGSTRSSTGRRRQWAAQRPESQIPTRSQAPG